MQQHPLGFVIEFLKNTDELKAGSELLKVFRRYSNNIDQFDQLGMYFNEMKDYHSALECAQRALELSTNEGQRYATRSNLAKLYNHTNDPEISMQYSKQNLAVNPRDYEAKMEMIFSHYLSGDFATSHQEIKNLLQDPMVPDDIRLRCEFNLGSYLIDEGEFKQGILNFIDVGHRIGIWKKYDLPLTQWYGEVIPGKTVAIIAEGGIGDEVINIRFMENIKKLGMYPVFVTGRKNTAELFRKNGFNTVSSIREVPSDALGIKSMYLPIALDLDKNELWNGPYLKPDPAYIEKWKKLLPSGRKIAIRWAGNMYYDQDLHRTVPLERYNEVLDFSRDDITFVSVQKDGYEGIENYPKVFDAAPHLEDLDDLLACLSLMDYTISSCTSVSHVCSAAGFPITVCPPIATYYTWLGDSKWYGDNCTILRQRKWRDWSHLEQLKDVL
jgi:tetratricopeptide (TPR) repeat protein